MWSVEADDLAYQQVLSPEPFTTSIAVLAADILQQHGFHFLFDTKYRCYLFTE